MYVMIYPTQYYHLTRVSCIIRHLIYKSRILSITLVSLNRPKKTLWSASVKALDEVVFSHQSFKNVPIKLQTEILSLRVFKNLSMETTTEKALPAS